MRKPFCWRARRWSSRLTIPTCGSRGSTSSARDLRHHRPRRCGRGLRPVPRARRGLGSARADATGRRLHSARNDPPPHLQGRSSADRRRRDARWPPSLPAGSGERGASGHGPRHRRQEPRGFGAIGELDDFWIDRFEVTNRQFKEFVDGGGYSRREYWPESFVASGRTIPWEAAVERFRDTTGRPGPRRGAPERIRPARRTFRSRA